MWRLLWRELGVGWRVVAAAVVVPAPILLLVLLRLVRLGRLQQPFLRMQRVVVPELLLAILALRNEPSAAASSGAEEGVSGVRGKADAAGGGAGLWVRLTILR